MGKNDVKFADGFFVKHGNFHDGHTHLKIGVKVSEFAQFVKDNQKDTGWLNLEIKTGKGGLPYCCLDTFEPKAQEEKPQPEKVEDNPDDDLPF